MLDSASEEWQECQLSHVIRSIYGGGTPDKSKPDYWDGDIYWASVKDMVTFDPNSTQDRISQNGLSQSSSKIVPAGTLVICTRMAVGFARIFSTDVAINQDLKAIVPNKHVLRDFLYFWFEFKRDYFESIATGTTVKGLRQNLLVASKLALPPIAEQERIAEILTSVDDSIRATEAVNAQAERVKRGLMEDLLTGGLGSEAIARGEVPEGWAIETLEDLTYRSISYGVLKPGDYAADGVPMLRIQDAKNGWKDEDLWRISAKLDEEYKRTRVNEGDLIFSVVGTLGECKQINAALAGANVSRAFAVIGLSEAVEKEYVFHFLTSDFVLAWVAETGRGGAQKVINLGDLRKLTVPLPSSNEQRRIVEVLNCSAKQVSQNRKTIEQLQRLKRGLMDDLLTGRVRTV